MSVVLDMMASSISHSVGSTLLVRCRQAPNIEHDWQARLVVQHESHTNGPCEDVLTDWAALPEENITSLLKAEARPDKDSAVDIKYTQLTDVQQARLLENVSFEFELGTDENPLPTQ